MNRREVRGEKLFKTHAVQVGKAAETLSNYPETSSVQFLN